MTCFGRWGVPRTRMEDIAKEAGVARPALYRYFPSKDALQLAVMVRHIQRRTADPHRSVPVRGPAGPLILRALVAGITDPPVDQVSASVLGVDVVHDTARLVGESAAIAEAMQQYWQPYLRHAADRGELRTGVTIDSAVRWLTMIVFYFLTLPEVAPPPARLKRDLQTFVVDAIIKA
jgi:AcrR family transcriptional regulator